MSPARRSIGVALMAALLASLGTQCLEALETGAPQMPCCAGTAHDCHAAVSAQECCQSERAELAELAAYVQPPASLPPPAPLDRLPQAWRTDDHPAVPASDAPLPGSPPPRYVLLASFLI